jgi:hypothetical protein
MARLHPAVFDADVPAFDKAGFAEALQNRLQAIRIRLGRAAAKVTDDWHPRLLRARRQRPRRRTAE